MQVGNAARREYSSRQSKWERQHGVLPLDHLQGGSKVAEDGHDSILTCRRNSIAVNSPPAIELQGAGEARRIAGASRGKKLDPAGLAVTSSPAALRQRMPCPLPFPGRKGHRFCYQRGFQRPTHDAGAERQVDVVHHVSLACEHHRHGSVGCARR